MKADEGTHTWWPLPRRSRTDRKLGGVAGGLGRAWNIDPVLIRVAFVVMALFGGSGVLIYCAGWLLMRDDADNGADEVSALEALVGKGKSSTSPALTLLLIIVGLGSVGSVFSWGIPFWPVVVGAIILAVVLSQRGRVGPRDGAGNNWTDDLATRASRWGRDFGDRAGSWFDNNLPKSSQATDDETGRASDRSTEPTSNHTAPDETGAATHSGDNADSGDGEHNHDTPPSPEDLFASERTPPAWDPLGAAPFAWDLPEPSPLPGDANIDSNTADSEVARGRGSIIARITLGLTLIVGSMMSAGVSAGWWDLRWSAVTGIGLGVLAVGLTFAALRGRGSRMLIGPGVFLAVLTLALSVSGLSGTSGFGQHNWMPPSTTEVAGSYYWNAGDAELDLSNLTIPPGQTVHTNVTIGGGQVSVLLPAGVAVQAQCSATVGVVRCLDRTASGVRTQVHVERPGDGRHGTIDITIHSNAGRAVLATNG